MKSAQDGDLPRNRTEAVFAILASAKAPVQITIGLSRPGQPVDMQWIIVHKASSAVVTRLVDGCVMVSMIPEGLLIPVTGA